MAGVNGGFIVESYAIGNVGLTAVGGSYPPGFNTVGGLIGVNSSSLMSSYTEPLSISGSGATGQLPGWNNGSINSSYATVGGNSLVGVSLGIESGSAAVSSATLQAGLPSGFDPSIWSQNRQSMPACPHCIGNKARARRQSTRRLVRLRPMRQHHRRPIRPPWHQSPTSNTRISLHRSSGLLAARQRKRFTMQADHQIQRTRSIP